MRVAVIGCGYVGTAAARHWAAALGWQVTATTTSPERLVPLEAVAGRAILWNSGDPAGLASVLEGQQVVLLSVGARSPLEYERTYVQTARMLTEALAANGSVRQVIYTGSYSVYGDRGGAWVDEATPPAPDTRNGKILLQAEQILAAAATEARRVCIFRLGGIHGPGRELIDLFGGAFGQTLPGDGSDWGNWIHLDDIVAALTFAIDRHLGGVWNLVGDEPATRRALIEKVFAAHGLSLPTWDNAPPAGPKPYNSRVSNARLKAAGFSLQHPCL
jgi:nucleoside-diphosphate-sugar epimerase